MNTITKPTLQTKYLGLTLNNPIVVSSSGLTSTIEKVKQVAQAGAGAIVLKSIFEEQLTSEAIQLENYTDYPEAADYLKGYIEGNAMEQYLELIKVCAAECQIPIIASINCSTKGNWVDYALKMQNAGAAAIELNIFIMPTERESNATEIEKMYLDIVQSVKDVISIPLTIKLPQGFTSPLAMIKELYYRGVKGITLFNRFYSPDIDIEKMKVVSGNIFSTPSELSQSLRWAALSSVAVPLVDVSISTGVHSGQDAIKGILSGANTISICSTLYENGIDYISNITATIEQWMKKHNFATIEEFRGKLNASQTADSTIYERAQFMKYFSSVING